MTRWALLFLVALSLLPFPESSAGIPFDQFMAFNESIGAYDYVALWTGHYGCIVVTVVQEDPIPGTHGRPPHPLVNVDEVLRGKATIGRHVAIWEPIAFDTQCTGIIDSSAYALWSDRPLPGPKHGERFILLTELTPGESLRIEPFGRYPFTLERRDRALKVVADMEARAVDPKAWDARQESLAVANKATRENLRRQANKEFLSHEAPCVVVATARSFQSDEHGVIVGLEVLEILKTDDTDRFPRTVPDNRVWYTWIPDSVDADPIFDESEKFLVLVKLAPPDLFPPGYLPRPRLELYDPALGAFSGKEEVVGAFREAVRKTKK
jgi:hypothetical protein